MHQPEILDSESPEAETPFIYFRKAFIQASFRPQSSDRGIQSQHHEGSLAEFFGTFDVSENKVIGYKEFRPTGLSPVENLCHHQHLKVLVAIL